MASVDFLKQLGEGSYKRLTHDQQVAMVENMLTQAESKHFEAVCNIPWAPQKAAEAKQIQGMIDTLEKELATLKARQPEQEKS